MKKRILMLLVLLLCLSSLAACGGEKVPQADAGPRSGILTVRFQYEREEIRDGDVLLMTSDCVTPTVQITGNSDAAARIQSSLTEWLGLGGTDEENIADIKDIYSNWDANFGNWTGFRSSIDCLVTRGDGSVVSLAFTHYYYNGGAHGNYDRCGMSFDASTGEALTIDGISNDPQTLRDRVANWILSDPKMPEDGMISTAAEFAGHVLDTDQWCLTDDGLLVWADPYEIASFADGIIEFTVPYSELDGLLLKQYMPGEKAVPIPEQLHVERTAGTGEKQIVASALLDAQGDSFYIWADGAADSISLTSIDRADDEWNGFEPHQLFYLSSLAPGEALEVTAQLMDTPSLQVSFGRVPYLIAESGNDGVLSLRAAE